MTAWPVKFMEGSKPGKKHSLPIDLFTENKKAKRSAYLKTRELVTETTFNLDIPATSNNQYFILLRFYYSSNEYFDIK
jgi:hypothetical protein